MAKTWHDFDDYDDIKNSGLYSESFLKEQGARYGLNPDDRRYQREDVGSEEKFDQDGHFLKDLMRLANNDYDYRRSQEAARLSAGNIDYKYSDKKWSEMTDKERKGLKRKEHMANKEAGVVPNPRFDYVPSKINSLEDIFEVNKFMRDTYEDKNLGDKDFKNAYGSAHQRAAVKDYFVDLDRSNLREDFTPKDDSPDKKKDKDKPAEPAEPDTLSDRTKEAIEFVDNHSWYDPDVKLVQDTIPLTAAATDMNAGIANEVASAFTDKYKLNLVAGLQKADVPTRGAGAPGTPGGFRV